jgi:protein-tyrosine phosphatase
MNGATLRSIARSALNHVERTLHPGRRRRAAGRLRRTRPRRILFVCLGNICRSPIAKHMLDRSDVGVEVQSSGFIGPDRAPPPEALRAAMHLGIDHACHRSRLTTVDMLADAEAIFVFDAGNRRRVLDLEPGARSKIFWLGDFDPDMPDRRMIRDPWGRTPEDFVDTFVRIDRCVTHVAQLLREASETNEAGPLPPAQ